MSAIAYGTIVAAREDVSAPWYGMTASGYGRKIPTRYWVRLAGDTTSRWRRVYVMIFANSGSIYCQVRGTDVFLEDIDLELALGR